MGQFDSVVPMKRERATLGASGSSTKPQNLSSTKPTGQKFRHMNLDKSTFEGTSADAQVAAQMAFRMSKKYEKGLKVLAYKKKDGKADAKNRSTEAEIIADSDDAAGPMGS